MKTRSRSTIPKTKTTKTDRIGRPGPDQPAPALGESPARGEAIRPRIDPQTSDQTMTRPKTHPPQPHAPRPRIVAGRSQLDREITARPHTPSPEICPAPGRKLRSPGRGPAPRTPGPAPSPIDQTFQKFQIPPRRPEPMNRPRTPRRRSPRQARAP